MGLLYEVNTPNYLGYFGSFKWWLASFQYVRCKSGNISIILQYTTAPTEPVRYLIELPWDVNKAHG